jgi:hypothetical protein
MNSSFWLESLLRSTTLLLLGGVALKIAWSASAAVKHRLLLCVLALLSALPISVVLLPQLPVSLWRATPAR